MIASFRMYNAVPRAAQAWRALFARVFADAGTDIRMIEHAWPEPIDALWAKPDLACAFMCGWPFARSPGMQAIAAPVPSPPRYEGLPRYLSEFLVREASGWTSLEDTFGHRIGWMAANSQSGFNAPRAHLARYASAARPALYAESRGPLGSPASTLEALRAGDVDVVALDGFIPLLVAAPGIAPAIVEALRARLLGIHRDPGCANLLADALVARFVAPRLEDYVVFDALAAEASARGYPAIR